MSEQTITTERIAELRALREAAKTWGEVEIEKRKSYEMEDAFAEPARSIYFAAGEDRAQAYQAWYTAIDTAAPELLAALEQARALLARATDYAFHAAGCVADVTGKPCACGHTAWRAEVDALAAKAGGEGAGE